MLQAAVLKDLPKIVGWKVVHLNDSVKEKDQRQSFVYSYRARYDDCINSYYKIHCLSVQRIYAWGCYSAPNVTSCEVQDISRAVQSFQFQFFSSSYVPGSYRYFIQLHHCNCVNGHRTIQEWSSETQCDVSFITIIFISSTISYKLWRVII